MAFVPGRGTTARERAARGRAGSSGARASSDGASGARPEGGASGRGDCSTELAELVDRWGDYLRAVEGKAPKTWSAYRSAALRFLADARAATPEAVTREAIERHLKRLYYADLSPSSISSALVAIKVFARYLVAHELLPTNPAQDLRSPKVYRQAKRVLSVAEVRRLVYGDRPDLVPRDTEELVAAVLVAVSYGAALRPSEPGRLRTDDVEWSEEDQLFSVLVRGGKHATGDVRIPVGRELSRLLGAYLAIRPRLGPGVYLFPVGNGARPMSRDTVGRRFADLVARRGLEARGRTLAPKILRSSRCTHLLDKGHNVKVVSRFMRHRSVETTIAHYAYGDDGRVVRMLVRADPFEAPKRRPPALRGAMRALLDELGAQASAPVSVH